MKNWTVRFREVDKDNFDEVKEGSKSIETRAASIKYRPIQVGDTLTFVCGKERLTKTIIKKYHWKTIDQMLEEVPMNKIMPTIHSVEAMKKVYASYPGYEEKIKEYGLFGFEIS